MTPANSPTEEPTDLTLTQRELLRRFVFQHQLAKLSPDPEFFKSPSEVIFVVVFGSLVMAGIWVWSWFNWSGLFYIVISIPMLCLMIGFSIRAFAKRVLEIDIHHPFRPSWLDRRAKLREEIWATPDTELLAADAIIRYPVSSEKNIIIQPRQLNFGCLPFLVFLIGFCALVPGRDDHMKEVVSSKRFSSNELTGKTEFWNFGVISFGKIAGSQRPICTIGILKNVWIIDPE